MEKNKLPAPLDEGFSPTFLVTKYAEERGLSPPKKRRVSGSNGSIKQPRQPSSGISSSLQDLIDGKPYSPNTNSKEINNNKTNSTMGVIKNLGGSPKTDDEIMREAEYDRIMRGEFDISKDYFPMLALGVYFDKINYQ